MVEEIVWKDIVKADIEELREYCKKFDLSTRGGEEELRERLMRRVLRISLPPGEIFLEGKLNINTATPEEMRLWPYMGETMIQNILDYRNRYGRFQRIDDLLNVKGIGSNLLKKLMQFIDVAGQTHIRIKKDISSEADLEFIRLEEDIRAKAWELKDMKEHMDIDMEYIGELMMDIENDMELLAIDLREVERFQGRLSDKEKELEELRSGLAEHYEYLKGMEKKKEAEYRALLEEAENLRAQAREKLSEAEAVYSEKMTALEEEIRSRRMEIEELEKRIAEEKQRIDEERELLEVEKKELMAEQESLEIERKEFQDERNMLEDEKGLVESAKKELEEREEELKADIERLEAERKALTEEKERLEQWRGELEAKESDIEQAQEKMEKLEERLKRLVKGVTGEPMKGLDSLEIETVDIPVVVPLDPEDENPDDDMVVLTSTDGYIQRTINVQREGVRMDEHYSKVVFPDLPRKKAYNILVDTGEERYYILKNFRPGGEE